MRKHFIRILSSFLLAVLLLPFFSVIAFAGEDEVAEFPSSNEDFKNYEGKDEATSTWELLRKVYGSEEHVGAGNATYRKGFFWSHGVSVSAGNNYPLYAGLWGCHPAIYISVLPEAQLTVRPAMVNNPGFTAYKHVPGWSAVGNMSMNYWLALAQFFRYDSEKYKFYKNANNGEIKAYIYLEKAAAGSNNYKQVCKSILTVASIREHTNAMAKVPNKELDGRFYRTNGLYHDPINEYGTYYFNSDYSETDTSAIPANNSVLFYNLESGAKYRVSITVRISYVDESGTSRNEIVFDDDSIIRAFSDNEKDGLISVLLCGYAVVGNGNGTGLILKNLGYKTRGVSLIEASRYVDSGLNLDADDPIALMQDVTLFQTNPLGKDAEKLSSVFKLLRRLAITASIFGLGWAIFRVVLIDASGFMLMRLKMELQGWLGLIVIIGASVWVLSTLVSVLFGI